MIRWQSLRSGPTSKNRLLILVGAVVLLAGCTPTGKSARPQATTTSSTAGSATTPPADPATPVWLCQPTGAADPCTADLDTRVVSATGASTVQSAKPATDPPFDCFYVYPTVSSEQGPNADLTIQPAETEAAEAQASRFSTVCRVWAPMYRQVTLDALITGGLPALNTAYASLLTSWRYYLQHENGGRPFVLIGHSQGAAMLIRLIEEQIDPNPSVRSRLVVAILAGGNLQVPTGRTVGATFKNVPLCTSPAIAGCAIAYSTFGSQPPPDALFGRPGAGVSLLSLQLTSAGQQVACVNPASLAGGTAGLSPYFRSGGPPPWVTYPGLYTASCQTGEGATWLQVDATKSPGDNRPVVTAAGGPVWGYHGDDVNLTLGNLVSDVSALESAYHP